MREKELAYQPVSIDRFYIIQPELVKQGDEFYAWVTIQNRSLQDSIIRVDLYRNHLRCDSTPISTNVLDCVIPPYTSQRISFRLNIRDESSAVDGLFCEAVVARFSNDQVYYHDGKDEEGHIFPCVSLDQIKPKERDEGFAMLGNADSRPENFDQCPVPVTEDNVYQLYRKYDVEKISSTDLYKVVSKAIYTNSAYLTRLIKFKDGKQVAAATFYYWNIPYVFAQDSGYMAAFNSLGTTSGGQRSTFTAKTVLLDSTLNVVKQHEFRYKQQRGAWYDYVYIDTIIPRKNGYDFRVINTGFDSDDYMEYKGILNFNNDIVSSEKHKRMKR